jgi:hypothetical protein
MATDLRPPEEDEPLFGVISRYADELHVQDWQRFLRNLFGYRAHFSSALAYNLSCVAEQTAATWEVSPGQIAEKCTLFPFYAAFVLPEQAAIMLETLIVRQPRTLPRFMLKLIQQRKVVRCCDACLSEDTEGVRPRHFRRVHQLPGVVVCPTHGIWLRSFAYMSSAVTPWPSIGEARAGGPIASFAVSPDQRANLRRVARAAQYLLEARVTVDAEQLRRLCWRALHDAGFAHGRDALQIGQVVQAFTSFYGPDYLRMVNLHPNTDQNWIAARLAGRQVASCTLPNLLLGVFCGNIGTSNVLEAWPSCPNNLASHGPGHRVEVRESHNGRYYARCRCGHSFTYQSVTEGAPVDVTVTVYGPDYADRARSLFSAGQCVADIARTLRISETTARRMVYKKVRGALPSRSESVAQLRARWQDAARQYGTVRMTSVMKPGLWKAIRRYAPEVLKRSSLEQRQEGPAKV